MFWVKSFSMGFGALGMNFSWKNDVFVSFLLFWHLILLLLFTIDLFISMLFLMC